MATQKGMYGQTPTGPTDPDAWLGALDDVRRPQLEELDARIRKLAPGGSQKLTRVEAASASSACPMSIST